VSVLDIATRYVELGFSVIPVRCDGTKAPLLPGWREFSERRPTGEELLHWFGNGTVAGIGNLYASEILHLSRIHPARPANRLKPAEISRLHEAVQVVLEEAIRDEGSTLSDATYRNALNQNGRYQNKHRVYDRADQPCTTCSTGTIRRIVQAQRSTFFCPECQKKGSATRGR